jgi:hypothetical protein
MLTFFQDPSRAAQSFSTVGSHCLYRAVSTMELIQDRWETIFKLWEYRRIKHAVEAGLCNIRKWYRRMDDTDVYVMSMALNPVIKLAFIRISWDPKYVKMAENILEDDVSSFNVALSHITHI